MTESKSGLHEIEKFKIDGNLKINENNEDQWRAMKVDENVFTL
jgi:hypothetical protein